MRILIADDHEVVRRGLKLILQDEFGRVKLGEARTGREVIDQVRTKEWDLVLLDISLPYRSGLDALTEIKQLRPQVPVLILSASPETEYAVRTIRQGAAGYINKQYASDELLVAIKKVLAGGTYVSPAIAEKLASSLRADSIQALHERLSDREFQIMRMIALGKSVKQIAAELALSEKTVGTYLLRIKGKTGLTSHVEITRYAIRNRLVD